MWPAVVHKDEYVIPSWLMNSPGMLDVVGMLEAMRTTGSTTVNNTYNQQSYTTNNAAGSDNGFVGAINRLNENLERGIAARVAYREMEEFEEEVTEIRDSVSR
jgi:hypothetical protein